MFLLLLENDASTNSLDDTVVKVNCAGVSKLLALLKYYSIGTPCAKTGSIGKSGH